MKFAAINAFACAILFSGCEEKKEITVTETRTTTTRDTPPKLFATSDERFRDAKPSPVKGETPVGWQVVPATQFRLLNYRFGETGSGEVWVSLASGTVLDNVNRWLKQFGASSVDASGLAKLSSVEVAGSSGTWVVAEGEYAGGMGAPSKQDYGLSGIVAPLKDGQILTVKMVGPKAEVVAAQPILKAFAQTLRLVE